MIKLITLLLFTSTSYAANESCHINSYAQILKINKSLDDTIIQDTTCNEKIINAFISFISSAYGKLNSKYLESHFKIKFDAKVTVSPNDINIKDIKNLIEEEFAKDKIVISSITSLYGKSSFNLKNGDQFKIDCTNCTKTGDRNLKLQINSQSYWVSAKVLKKRFAYIAKNMINVRTPIMEQSDFDQTIVADFGKSNVFTDIDKIQFFKLNKNLHTGETLKYSDLTAKKLVSVGQKVNVLYKGNSINLKTVSIAKKNGRYGDYIQVQNPKSKKILTGKVLNYNTVVVEL